MSQTQKIIKNLAIALAVFLVVTIIGSIAFAFIIIGNIFFNEDTILKNPKIIEISPNIENINIEVSTNLKIIRSSKFQVETNNSNLKIKEKRNTIIIEETPINIFNTGKSSTTVIYIPENQKINTIDLETGAGILKIEDLTSNNLDMELGAGKVTLDNLNILNETSISGGTGKINITDSILNNSEIEVGIGELNMSAQLIGNNQIECGIGNSKIELLGTKEDYKLLLEKGIGNIKVNNNNIKNETTYGSGSNRLDISSGIGNIEITFNDVK